MHLTCAQSDSLQGQIIDEHQIISLVSVAGITVFMTMHSRQFSNTCAIGRKICDDALKSPVVNDANLGLPYVGIAALIASLSNEWVRVILEQRTLLPHLLAVSVDRTILANDLQVHHVWTQCLGDAAHMLLMLSGDSNILYILGTPSVSSSTHLCITCFPRQDQTGCSIHQAM